MTPTNPLDQLKDIHLPDAPSIWPIAWPWWLALAILIVIIAALLWRKRKHAWRKIALAQLAHLETLPDHDFVRQSNRLMKTIAVRQLNLPCAHLSGVAWLHFLDQQVASPVFLPGLESYAFAVDSPNPSIDKQQVMQACAAWIRRVKC